MAWHKIKLIAHFFWRRQSTIPINRRLCNGGNDRSWCVGRVTHVESGLNTDRYSTAVPVFRQVNAIRLDSKPDSREHKLRILTQCWRIGRSLKTVRHERSQRPDIKSSQDGKMKNVPHLRLVVRYSVRHAAVVGSASSTLQLTILRHYVKSYLII